MASRVTASVVSLIKDKDDIIPYIEDLADGLKSSLTEIVPEVRALAAKAIGALVSKLGRAHSEHILQTLRDILESVTATSIEKAGAAQGFCEALVALGDDMITKTFDSLIAGTKDSREHVRESFINIFVYLPIVMGESFEKYISEVLNSVIDSIYHNNENIRNLSVKTMQNIIKRYSEGKIDLILEPLFDGMLSSNWIKRDSSAVLTGDLIDIMFKEDETKSKYTVFEERPRTFTILYIIKNDPVNQVKITATNIWKTFIENTPKTLKVIFNDITKCFIELLISGSDYHNNLCDVALKEFIGKYGDVFLTDILAL